jgi:hypothetical protein
VFLLALALTPRKSFQSWGGFLRPRKVAVSANYRSYKYTSLEMPSYGAKVLFGGNHSARAFLRADGRRFEKPV